MSFTTFSTLILPTVEEVRLYQDTIGHIREEHPEVPIILPLMVEAIGNTIVNPTHVESSYGGSYVYVDAGSTNAAGDPLRVPIKPVVGTSARVRTAYFASTTGPVNIIWRRA